MSAPWQMAKDPERAAALDHVLYALAESLRIVAILMSPILPKSASETFYQLNWKGDCSLAETRWGILPHGHVVGKPKPLFPRIETAAL